MNRRTFFQRAAQVAAAVVIAPTVFEVLAPEAGYSTYVMGANAMPALTFADLRQARELLLSAKPIGPISGWIHPQVVKDLEREAGYKFKWTVEASSRS